MYVQAGDHSTIGKFTQNKKHVIIILYGMFINEWFPNQAQENARTKTTTWMFTDTDKQLHVLYHYQSWMLLYHLTIIIY